MVDFYRVTVAAANGWSSGFIISGVDGVDIGVGRVFFFPALSMEILSCLAHGLKYSRTVPGHVLGDMFLGWFRFDISQNWTSLPKC